jgi:hypothetical protein
MNNLDHFVLAGVDIELYDMNLKLIDKFTRKNKENSIRFIILIKHDKLVIATNNDLEVYALLQTNQESDELKIKELKKCSNAHENSILNLSKISGKFNYLTKWFLI